MSHKYQSERDSKFKQRNNNDKSKNYTLSTGSLRGLSKDSKLGKICYSGATITMFYLRKMGSEK